MQFDAISEVERAILGITTPPLAELLSGQVRVVVLDGDLGSRLLNGFCAHVSVSDENLYFDEARRFAETVGKSRIIIYGCMNDELSMQAHHVHFKWVALGAEIDLHPWPEEYLP